MKKRSKKGVTLVELIAVIAILGVISTIGFTIYGGVKKKTLERQYENLISLLETKAEKYASDTGILNVNIDTLIKEGYIDADNKEGYLYNPINKEPLNCYVINSETDKDNFLAKFDPTVPSINKPNNCPEVIKEYVYNIAIKNIAEDKYENINSDTWYGNKYGDILIVKDYDGNKLKKNDYIINWSTNAGGNIDNEENYSIQNFNGLKTLTAEIIDNKTNKILGVTRVSLKVDKEKPTITSTILDNSKYSKEKKINLVFKDNSFGSGLQSYAINSDSAKEINGYETKVTETVSKKSITVSAIDKAGNKSEPLTINDIRIDTTKPTIGLNYSPAKILYNGKTMYTNYNVTVYAIISDDESGLKSYKFQNDPISFISNKKSLTVNKEYSENVNGEFIEVCDNAGNCNNKLIEIDYIDKSSPIIKVNSIKPSNDYLTAIVNFSIEDSLSGVYGYKITETKKKGSNIKNWDFNSNYKNINYSNINKNGTYYVYARDGAGNISEKKIIIDCIDNTAPKITKFNVKSGPDKNYNVKLEGVATDEDGVITEYSFSQNSNLPNFWTSVPKEAIGKSVTLTHKTEGNRGNWYFWVKDKAGNISEHAIVYIDDKAPVYNYGGELSTDGDLTCNVSAEKAYFTDDSPYTVYYYFNTSSTNPTSSLITSTSRKPYTSCDNWYYAWCKAVDKWGNESEIKELGNIYSGKSCNEGEYTYDYCDSDGWKVESRYNSCIRDYQYRYYPYIKKECYSDPYPKGSWSECYFSGSYNEDFVQKRKLFRKFGGYEEEYKEEEQKCSYCADEGNWKDDFVMNSKNWHHSSTYVQEILHNCNKAIANGHCHNLYFNKDDGYWYYTENNKRIVTTSDLDKCYTV